MPDPPEFDRASLSQLVRSTYDRTAERYAELFLRELEQKPFDREWLARFAEAVPDGGLVCDAGCGPGQIGRFVRERGVRVCGIDLAPKMAVAARRHTGHASYAAGNMLSLPLRDRALQGLVAFYSLIHLRREDLPRALAEFARVLASGAPLLCSVHAGEGALYVEEVFDSPEPMYATLFGRDELVSRIEEAGFAIADAVERAPLETEGPTRRLYVLARRG